MIEYYAAEIQKILAVPAVKPYILRFLNFVTDPRRSRMSEYCQAVQDYIRACETLLKAGQLSDNEMEAVQEMLLRISDKLLDDGES